jgi:GT2 family glycosyltransferase
MFKFGASYLEFGSRLHSLGYRIRYLRGTYVVHHADPQNRSFMDRQEELAATSFAILSHSFRHQPSLRNKALTALELGRQVVTAPRSGGRAVMRGYRAFRAIRAGSDRRHRRPTP